MRHCRDNHGTILVLTDGIELASNVFAYLPIGHGDFAIEVNGDGALGLLNDVANAVGYACAYLLKFTGGDIFDEVVNDCPVFAFKFTDLSADSKNLCKVIGLHPLFFPGCGDLGHGVGLGAGGDVDVGFHGFVVGVAGPFHDSRGGMPLERAKQMKVRRPAWVPILAYLG